jgi:hypothetical protein
MLLTGLLPHHLTMLTEESGIAMDIIRKRGYRSIHGPDSATRLKGYGFKGRVAGNLVRKYTLSYKYLFFKDIEHSYLWCLRHHPSGLLQTTQ